MTSGSDPKFMFEIEIPADLVDEAARRLTDMGIPFDPGKDLVCIDVMYQESGESNHCAVNYGEEIPDLVQGINDYLQQNNIMPLCGEYNEDWSLADRHEFLSMATSEFQFTGFKVARAWWQEDGTAWEKVLETHSLIPAPAQSNTPGAR